MSLNTRKNDLLISLKGQGLTRRVLAISMVRLSDALSNSLLMIVIPLIIHDLHAEGFKELPRETLVGIAIAVYGFTMALGQRPMANLTDRIGRRKPFILAGLLALALITFSYGMVESYPQLIMLRFLHGMAAATIIPASLGLLVKFSSQQSRGGSMGFYTTFRGLGFFLGPILSGYITVTYGRSWVFATGAFFVVLGFLFMLTVGEGSRRTSAQADEESMPGNEMAALATSHMILAVVSFAWGFGMTMMTTLENEFNERLGQDAFHFGIAFSAMVLVRLFLQFPFGRLSDRIGRKRVIMLGLCLMAPATILLGYAPSTEWLIFFRALQGIGSAALASPLFALAADLSQAGKEAQQVSLIATGFGLGLASGPLVTGFLAGYVSFYCPFYVAAAMTLLGALFVWLIVPGTSAR